MDGKPVKYPFFTIVFISFVLLVVVPVLYTLGTAFFSGTLEKNLASFGKDTWVLLSRSSLAAFSVALLSTLLGTVLGFLVYKTHVKFRGFFKLALLVPLFISPYILAVAWKDLFFLFSGGTGFITSFAGMVLILTTIYTPLAMLITGSAMAGIHAPLEESGLVITRFSRMVLKVILPLIKPALISSFVLVFIFGISEFSVAAFLGVRVFTTEIFTQFSAFYNHSLAILQSTLLIVICVLLLLAEGKYLADAPFLAVGSKGDAHRIYHRKNLDSIGLFLLSGWLFISVILPFLVLFEQTFQKGADRLLQAFALLKHTFADSILLALGGALLIVVTGLAASWRDAGRPASGSKKVFDWLLLIVFAIPSTILGISLIKFYNRPGLDVIYSGYAIILIGYVGKFSFISSRLTGNALRQIPASLDEAAQIAGISRFSRTVKIGIPLILPTLFVAFLTAFIFSLGELGTTIMVYPPGTEIMPIKVFTIMANAPQALTSAMTLIVFSVTLLLIAFFYLLMKPLMRKYSYVAY